MKFKKAYLFAIAFVPVISCTENSTEIENFSNKNISDIEIANRTPQKFRNSEFYNTPSEASRVTFTGTTTAELNQLINRESNEDGPGVIIEIPTETYYWNRINLKSNIHLEIEEDAKIIFDGTKGSVFSIGGSKNGNRIKNVSISGKNKKKFTIDISADNLINQNVTAIKIGRVDNFRVGDINIKDKRSSVNSVVLVHVPGASENRPGPKDGVIENISQTGAHTGYGLVQTYNADHILFKNLNCDGGITLRMETDDKGMKNDLKDKTKEGGIKDIFAYNIKNRNGLCAVMFSPHFVENGKVTIEKVKATGSAFALRIEKGFLELFDKDKSYPITPEGKKDFKDFIQEQFPDINGSALLGNPYKRNNGTQWATRLSPEATIATRNEYVLKQLGSLQAGNYLTSEVTDITALYKNNGRAKIKQAHLKFIPCNLWENHIKNPKKSLGMFNGFEYHGPSVSLSYDNTNDTNTAGNYNIILGGENFKNFPSDFIQNITPNTNANCTNKPDTITEYTASFPN